MKIKFKNGKVKEFDSLAGADLTGADLSEAIMSGVNLSGSDLFEADLCGADLSGANLSEADLSKADLCGANLYRASLFGADLCGADLSGANLSEAGLLGADLTDVKNIIAFYAGKHFAFYVRDSGYLKIGCKGMHINRWYEGIGIKQGYSHQEIAEYKAIIETIKSLRNI